MAATPAAGQRTFPTAPSIQLRLGGFLATALVTDEVSSNALDQAFPGPRSNQIDIKQQPGPIGTVALRLPLRARTQVEMAASVGRSTIRGNDGLTEWEVAPATVGNFVLGFGYLYRDIIALRAGIGATRLFVEERGMFSKGNSIKPLLEGGVSTGFNLGFPFEIDVRLQTHSYGTAALRDDSGNDGNVARAIVQIGTTLWKAGDR